MNCSLSTKQLVRLLAEANAKITKLKAQLTLAKLSIKQSRSEDIVERMADALDAWTCGAYHKDRDFLIRSADKLLKETFNV